MMRVSISSLLIILLGGGILFAVASVLEFIIGGVLGYVFFELLIGPGFGVPFRFFQLGLIGLSGDDFSVPMVLLDWLVWCVVFAALFHGIRALIR